MCARPKLSVCCGGIVGLGETDDDRIKMLHTLSTMETHPDSVPINALVPVEGTPLENNKRVQIDEMLRMIAYGKDHHAGKCSKIICRKK
jgi:biotin synthase